MTADNSRPWKGAAGAQLNLDKISLAPPHDNVAMAGTCLAAALDYASIGIRVFPLTARKKPLRNCLLCRRGGACPGRDACRCGIDTCHGFYAATTDPATIARWWTPCRDWQLGLRTGATSGLVVLDIDLDKGGLDSLIALQQAGLDIVGAGVQLSGSGQSFHLLFRHPGGSVPNSQSKLGKGLDVRGDGGYVVGAPSLHPNTGAPYELLGDLSSLPAWPMRPSPFTGSTPAESTKETLSAQGSKAVWPATSARVASWCRKVSRAEEGTRRSTLFWAACRLGEASGSQQVRTAAARALCDAAVAIGLDIAEVHATLLDGIRVGGAQ